MIKESFSSLSIVSKISVKKKGGESMFGPYKDSNVKRYSQTEKSIAQKLPLESATELCIL